jgi:hypothetical protein
MTTLTTSVRDDLLVLARNAVRFFHLSVDEELQDLSPLPFKEREAAFSELCERVDQLDRFGRGDVHWSEVIPDAVGYDRDEQAGEALKTFVELALDRLTGGDA